MARKTRASGLKHPLVSIVMGSRSDLPTMQAAVDTLNEFRVPHEVQIVSAHRTPQLMYDYATQLAARSVRVVIAGAGGAAHLPGMVASLTELPVVGVPVAIGPLEGLDALLSIAQMPAGVPVATVAVGNARNAALLAVQILAFGGSAPNDELQDKLADFKDSLRLKVLKSRRVKKS
ncbi:MAG: 5-(carboxyamino)imidazole ribonucleotide mutase [Bdellovibrionales bacterium]|nr:5-(carboxyamino)imidazole ribonucleotide mutase [Bdellovibrionales bacterium]